MADALFAPEGQLANQEGNLRSERLATERKRRDLIQLYKTPDRTV